MLIWWNVDDVTPVFFNRIGLLSWRKWIAWAFGNMLQNMVRLTLHNSKRGRWRIVANPDRTPFSGNVWIAGDMPGTHKSVNPSLQMISTSASTDLALSNTRPPQR